MMPAIRRSSPLRNKMKSSNSAPQPPVPGQGNSTPDRLLVSQALTQLCTEHRAVIYRSCYRGLTTAQIAADLGIAESMVKSQLHYALHALRQKLQNQTDTQAQVAPRPAFEIGHLHPRRDVPLMSFDDNTAL